MKSEEIWMIGGPSKKEEKTASMSVELDPGREAKKTAINDICRALGVTDVKKQALMDSLEAFIDAHCASKDDEKGDEDERREDW